MQFSTKKNSLTNMNIIYDKYEVSGTNIDNTLS